MQTDLMHDKAAKALKHMRASKVRYVVANNGPVDLEPMLAISSQPTQTDEDPHGYLVSLANACVNHDHPIAELLASMLANYRSSFGRPSWVMVCSEAHYTKRPADAEMPKRGELAKDYAENPDSEVEETLIVIVAQDDMVGGCEMVMHSQTFHYGDYGVIEWGEPEQQDEPVGGSLLDVVRAGFEPMP